MLTAIALAVIGRWANNQKFDPKGIVEGLFALLVVAMMDTGRTEPVAKGLAWLVLVVVLLGKNSPITGIAKSVTGNTGPKPQGGVQVL